MSSFAELLNSIQSRSAGLTLAELLQRHPDVGRRTAQRQIRRMLDAGQVQASGGGGTGTLRSAAIRIRQLEACVALSAILGVGF